MDLFAGWGPTLAQGAWMAVQVAGLSSLFGVLLGILAALACQSRSGLLRRAAGAYITTVRGLPQLLLILLVYFGSTVALTKLVALVVPGARPVEVPPYPAGVFALALIFGAYAAEVFRGAMRAVPRGQVEAAVAIGMNGWQVFALVQLPQMLRFALPGLGNIWVSTLKDTSLISIVGLGELMKAAELATSDTRRALFFYTAAGAIYLALTLASSLALHALERHAARGERRA
jgi:His/Glu/Gln/Arg/opine family amino acid ABC transporter permease subunit